MLESPLCAKAKTVAEVISTENELDDRYFRAFEECFVSRNIRLSLVIRRRFRGSHPRRLRSTEGACWHEHHVEVLALPCGERRFLGLPITV